MSPWNMSSQGETQQLHQQKIKMLASLNMPVFYGFTIDHCERGQES